MFSLQKCTRLSALLTAVKVVFVCCISRVTGSAQSARNTLTILLHIIYVSLVGVKWTEQTRTGARLKNKGSNKLSLWECYVYFIFKSIARFAYFPFFHAKTPHLASIIILTLPPPPPKLDHKARVKPKPNNEHIFSKNEVRHRGRKPPTNKAEDTDDMAQT